jgi:predicted nucleic acid-binding protein
LTWSGIVPEAICNTSPLLYLYRAGAFDWLGDLFDQVWLPGAVVEELREGLQRGYSAPRPEEYPWLTVVEPRAVPSEWLALDLGPGELSAMALALENPDRVVLLDDALARRVAQAAGLEVWGTLKVLLEAKSRGLVPSVGPVLHRLEEAGMWISGRVCQRVLALAGEAEGQPEGGAR